MCHVMCRVVCHVTAVPCVPRHTDLLDSHKVLVGDVLGAAGDSTEFVFDLGDSWRWSIGVVGDGDCAKGEKANELLDGWGAAPPHDINKAVYIATLNLLSEAKQEDLDAAASAAAAAGVGDFTLPSAAAVFEALRVVDAEGEATGGDGGPEMLRLPAGTAAWWRLHNTLRDKKNVDRLYFDPEAFDLEANRRALRTALATRTSKIKAVAGTTVCHIDRASGRYSAMSELDMQSRASSTAPKTACRACGVTVGLQRCACGVAWYCCKEHRKFRGVLGSSEESARARFASTLISL